MVAAAVGFYDAEGIWHPGYTDAETRFADHLDKMSVSVSEQFEDDRARLTDVEADLVDTGWVPLTGLYAANWSGLASGGYRVMSLRRIGKDVELRGWAQKTVAWAAFDTIATIPAQFRPADIVTAFARHSATAASFFDVSAAGVLRVGTAGNSAVLISHKWTIG